MSLDKLAPQSVEAEQSVLGSILIDADAILRVGDFLKPGDFYRQQHGEIYEAMLALHGENHARQSVQLSCHSSIFRLSPSFRFTPRAAEGS